MGELDKILDPTAEAIFLAVITIALIYGVTSWCILKKFRNYMNYVCLNLLLVQFLVLLCRKFAKVSVVAVIIGVYVILARGHWLVVVCHMFYIDIAKVFDGHMPKRRFLKSFLFGWILPILGTIPILFEIVSNFVDSFILLSPLILNIILFIIIVYSLFRSSDESGPTATSKCRRFYIAILIFVVGDISLLAYIIVGFLEREVHVRPYIYVLMLNPILLSVFLVAVKSNRVLWHAYYVNKLKQRLSTRRVNRNVNVDDRVVEEPTDSRPQVLDAQVHQKNTDNSVGLSLKSEPNC